MKCKCCCKCAEGCCEEQGEATREPCCAPGDCECCDCEGADKPCGYC